MKRYLTAKEVTEYLNITAQTLYAYVSRGLIRSEAGEGRSRRYLAEDVEKLKNKRDPARIAEDAAQTALRWGMPVLDSALTLITGEAIYYRGRDVSELAQTATLEQVAGLLWLCELKALPSAEFVSPPPLDPALPIIQKLIIALASQNDLAAYDRSPTRVAETGMRLLSLMTTVIGGKGSGSIAEMLSSAWNIEPSLIDAALILVADHELNASAFTARVVASADATPYAAVIAGLAAMSGTRHGGSIDRTVALLREVGEAQYARAAIAERLRRGENLPGFGHRLYPQGDPRAVLLLNLIRQYHDVSLSDAVITEAQAAFGYAPNVDMALATLEYEARLPRGSGLALFALGRTVGWIAHIIEQYDADELIRPRARYTGVQPSEE
jgi:citrate synthase